MSLLTHCRGLSLTGQIHPHYSKISFMNNLRKDIFMLNKNSIQPLYKQLMDIITQQIKNGTYKPGEKIPPEPELADLYHVSRITVRRTVEELCTQGYLIKHQGKGTFVKSPMIFRKFESQKNMSFSESCRQNDRIPESHVLSFCKKPANSVTSDFLQLTSDEEVFFLERLLLADSIPVIDVHTWLPVRLFPDFDPNAVENGSFFEYIKNTYRCTIAESSRSTISVTAASPDMAKTLRLSSGDPVLILDSYMEAPDGKPLYISREYIAGSRYTISF